MHACTGAPLGAALNFLLQLGFRAAGTPFALASLDDAQRAMAADVSQLGLLMPFKCADRSLCLADPSAAEGAFIASGLRAVSSLEVLKRDMPMVMTRTEGSVWLAPTRLALALAGGVVRPSQGDLSQGFIVVETNYRVYAYTASALQAAILRLFCRCECVLPNLFVGVLTRDSVAGALACGLAADQIVEYLRTHAHPHVAGRTPVVPEVAPAHTVQPILPASVGRTGLAPVPPCGSGGACARRWCRTRCGCGRRTRSACA